MHGARWTRNPLALLVTVLIVAMYLYGYASKIERTDSYSPVPAESANPVR